MSNGSEHHTIAALATAPAPAGIAVIRISGSEAANTCNALFRSNTQPTSKPRELILGNVIDHRTEQPIDQGLAVYMPGPNSFTGEDVVEFQIHGGPQIARKILESLFAFGVQPAEAGEFTKRAFLNGKLDLVQAESVADLIAATSESALRVAQDQLAGKLSRFIDKVAEPLRDTLAQVEAHIDFPEEDIEPSRLEALIATIQSSQAALQTLHDSYGYGQKIREGYKVLLCGPPNAGKSSLLNTLLKRERAIVTAISGTTRDLIEEECIIEDHRFVLCDSAGITDSDDTVEKLGIELSVARLSWADLVLIVIDGTQTEQDLSALLELVIERAPEAWIVSNKSDLAEESNKQSLSQDLRTFSISAKTSAGVSTLQSELVAAVTLSTHSSAEASHVLTHARHKEQVSQALTALAESLKLLKRNDPLELTSEELRTALRGLEEIVGKTYTDDILGRIFSQFCIGK